MGFNINNGKGNNKKIKPLLRSILSLGPTSSVILDSPYVDHRIRLGRGGVSGSQFIFCRVAEDDTEAKDEWRWLLVNKIKEGSASYLTKKKLMIRVAVFGTLFALVSNLFPQLPRWSKLVTGPSSIISCISFLWLMLSTGGIETRGDTYMQGR